MVKRPSFVRRWLRRLGALALLTGLLLLLAWPRPAEQLTDASGVRVRVMDGDSLRIGERVVRIEGIDAVELHQLCKAADGGQWSCGLDARAALEALVAGGNLRCLSREEDRYARAVARCSANGADDVGAALVRQGWAVSGDGRREGRYLAQETEAKAAGRGIWRGSFAQPRDWRAAHPRPIGDD